MKILCTNCNKDCGEIKDGKLLKGLKFICPVCESARIKQKAQNFNAKKTNNEFKSIRKMFGL